MLERLRVSAFAEVVGTARVAAVMTSVALITAPGVSNALDIRITFNPKQPLAAQAEATMPKGVRMRSTQPLISRGELRGIAPQISHVRCDGVAIARTQSARGAGWILPAKGCQRIAWTIGFTPLNDKGADASAQANLYDPKTMTWVVSEPASLLRWRATDGGRLSIQGAAPTHGGIVVDQRAAGAVLLAVPEMSDPPEFFVVGGVPSTTFTAGGRQTTYLHFGEAQYTKLAQQHTAALDYLMRITRAQTQPMPLTVAWLPIDESAGGIGAATGMTTLLVNAVAQRELVTPENTPVTLTLILQQQLQALLPAGMPTWVAVSLTEYYARKALNRSNASEMAPAAVDGLALASATPQRRMLEVQSRLENGETSDASGLHTEGPGFWLALDRAIEKTSGGKRSLDDELPDLVATEFGSARLPVALVEQWRQRAGAETFDALYRKFIGDL